MAFWELMLLAVGLSMDAFAVAICKGLAMDKVTLKRAAVVGLWFGGFQGLMPLLGWLLMWVSREKKPEGEVRTFVDRVIGNVWTVMGLSAWFVSMLALFTPMRLPILFIILLIMGMGTTVTGLIIRFTPTAVGGVAAIILAPFTLIAGNMWQPLLFIAGFVVMMIVPGHILNYKSNHPAR